MHSPKKTPFVFYGWEIHEDLCERSRTPGLGNDYWKSIGWCDTIQRGTKYVATATPGTKIKKKQFDLNRKKIETDSKLTSCMLLQNRP